MCGRIELEAILSDFTKGARELLGDKLKGVILYGSYARGDFDDESDIDVMVLVDIPKGELHRYSRPITKIADNADWDYNTVLSPTLTNAEEFSRYKHAMPFFRNVDAEGVRIA